MLRTTLFAAALAVSTIVGGCTDDPLPAPTPEVTPASYFRQQGPHSVGYTVMQQPRANAPDLVVKAWYPASAELPSAAEIEYAVQIKFAGFPTGPSAILGHAHLDAAPDAQAGPYPLVVLSHGFTMNPEWYHSLAEHLASHGFVVLGPEHTESDWITGVVEASVARPAEVSETIDLAATGALAAIIDSEHVAVLGHSYGGYTALAVAGARIDTQALAERCQDAEPEVAGFFCEPFLSGEQQLAELMGLGAAPEGLWPDLKDDRVDAVVSMAGDAYLFGEAGLASVTIPAMVLGGTADTGTPWQWGSQLTYDAVSSDARVLVSFEGAEHFIQVSTCDDMPWTVNLPPEFYPYVCEDPAWDKREALKLVNQLTSAFLADVLRNDPRGKAVLDPALFADVDALGVEVKSP